MVRRIKGKSTSAGRERPTIATVSDVALVLTGLTLIVSAFGNAPVRISGLVNLMLPAPGALIVQVAFGTVGLALLLRGLFDLLRVDHALPSARQWFRHRRQPRPVEEPALDIGIPPARNPLFTDREMELEELKRRFANELRLDLSGLGGGGKSSLAIEYLHRYRSQYPDGVFWLRGGTETTLGGDFAALAWLKQLDLPQRVAEEQEQMIRAVIKWLRANPNWLLVVDNLDDPLIPALENLLARDLQGHILVTCRVPVWSEPLEVRPLPPEAATHYLLKRTGQYDADSAAEVASLLDNLPLALEQAAGFMRDTGCPLTNYAALARTRLGELMREGKPRDYPDPVATTWSLSFGRIEQESPVAAVLLRLCAFLAPDGIPMSLPASATEHLRGDLAASLRDELALDRAIGVLRRYSLIERQGGTLRIHRLVQAVLRDTPTRQQWLVVVLQLLRANCPTEPRDPKCWPQCSLLLPHVQAALDLVGTEGVAEAPATSWLSNWAGLYLRARGQLGLARPLLERALAMRERGLGPQHSDTAESLNNFASLLRDMGEPAAALLFERALAIRERVLGPDHPDTANVLNNLAGLLRDQGEVTAAKPLFERVLAIRGRVLGPEHPDTATSLTGLALVLKEQGELAAARPLFERALAIRERVLGPEHPDTTHGLNSLAGLYQAQGELAAARPLFERTLAIREHVLGPDHPTTATSLNDLALLLKEQGDLATARPLFERALAIREQVLGPDHPRTISTRRSLDDLISSHSRPEGLEP
jgi:tetratricopeptide (TPR) repeat protein